MSAKYNLNFGEFAFYTLDKDVFLERLRLKRKGLHDIITLKKYLDWMFWLKSRRNYFAHQGHPYLTPLLQRKQTQLTEEQMNGFIEGSMDWSLFSSTSADLAVMESMREFYRFQIDLEFNHETVVKDIMTFKKQNRITGEAKNVLFFPLRAIDEDYTIFSEVMSRIIINLSGARRVRR